MKSNLNIKTNDDIKKRSIMTIINKIPGGQLLVPMIIAAIINTFFKGLMKIGNPSTAIFSSYGTMTVIGIMMVFIGIQFKPKELLLSLKRGGILILVKLIISIVAGILLMRFFGLKGIWGISTLALVVCISSCNPGMYIALMQQYGDNIDIANFTLLSIVGLPFVPVCILGFSSGYGIDYKSIIATLIPFLVGIIINKINDNARANSKIGMSIMIPFLGFCLGSNINIINALVSYKLGIVLFLIFIVVNNIPMLFVDKILLKQKGHASMAICCIAGLAVAIPKLMAEVDHSFAPYVQSATEQLAFVVAISAFVTPFIVKKVREI